MYRKLTANQIFNGYEILPEDSVLILAKNGVIEDIVKQEDAGDDIERFSGMLSPGFVNCHCHLELSHMRGLVPKHTGLIEFLMKIVENRQATEEEIQIAIEAAEYEMIQNGIVAVGDICNNTNTIFQKSKSNLHYQNFIEVAGFPDGIADKRFNAIQEIYHDFEKISKFNSIVPHAPYSVSTSLLEKITSFAGNEIMTMHNQETLAENQLYENMEGDFLPFYQKLNIQADNFTAKGKSSLQYFLPFFKLNQPLILVHNVYTKEEDIVYAQTIYNMNNPPLYFCLCPHANQYISNKLPDVDMFVKNNINLVLGTDSLASNDQLSIWEEIKLLQQHFPHINISEMLKWATSNGARALKIDERYGSFEVGKRPGVVLIGDNSECSPL
ncbi:MAG: amidohydrolase family protein [Bacteroidota bacterium]